MAQHHSPAPPLRVAPDPHRHDTARVRGGFRFNPAADSGWWSPGMYRLHGYQPGQVPDTSPGARLALTHCHPADRAAVRAAYRHLQTGGGLVAVHYRVLGADGVSRRVFVLATPVSDRHHRHVGVTGVMELDDEPTPPAADPPDPAPTRGARTNPIPGHAAPHPRELPHGR